MATHKQDQEREKQAAPEQQAGLEQLQQPRSLNEPPGSNVGDAPVEVEPPEKKAPEQEHEHEPPLPDNDTLHGMLRRELEELAADREVDIEDARTKEDIIEALRRDARKRRR